jgi:hypothetical protein
MRVCICVFIYMCICKCEYQPNVEDPDQKFNNLTNSFDCVAWVSVTVLA